MMHLQVCGHAFRTKPALVDRKIVTRLKTDNLVLRDEQVHTALHRAIRTMRWDNAVNHTISAPAIVRRIVQMWTIGLYDLIQVLNSAHQLSDVFREPRKTFSLACGKLAYASPRRILLQRGQQSCSVVPSASE